MIKRLTTAIALLASAAVLAVGGVALAQSTGRAHHKKATHHAVKAKQRAAHASESASESAGETSGESSESAPSDGPGGHEDPPGEVDQQFEGEQ
jgi:hypothetical protein